MTTFHIAVVILALVFVAFPALAAALMLSVLSKTGITQKGVEILSRRLFSLEKKLSELESRVLNSEIKTENSRGAKSAEEAEPEAQVKEEKTENFPQENFSQAAESSSQNAAANVAWRGKFARGENAELSAEPPAGYDAKPSYSESPENSANAKPRKSRPNLPFVLIGALALAFAGFFLVKFSIERGLLTPEARLALGAVFGTLLGACAVFLKRRKLEANVSNSLMGAAIAVFYADIFAANALYNLMPAGAATAGIVAVSAVAVYLSKFFTKLFLPFAVFATMIAPLILSVQNPNITALLAYVFIANAAAMVLWVKNRANIGAAVSSFFAVFWLAYANCAAAASLRDFQICACFILASGALFCAFSKIFFKREKLSESPETFESAAKIAKAAVGIIAPVACLVLITINAGYSNSYGFAVLGSAAFVIFAISDKYLRRFAFLGAVVFAYSASSLNIGGAIKVCALSAGGFALMASAPLKKQTLQECLCAAILIISAMLECENQNAAALIGLVPLLVSASLRFWKNPDGAGSVFLCLAALFPLFSCDYFRTPSITLILAAFALFAVFLRRKIYAVCLLISAFMMFLALATTPHCGAGGLWIKGAVLAFALPFVFHKKIGFAENLAEALILPASGICLAAALINIISHCGLAPFTEFSAGVFIAAAAVALFAATRERSYKISEWLAIIFAALAASVFADGTFGFITRGVEVNGALVFNDFALSALAPAAFFIAGGAFAKNKLSGAEKCALISAGILFLFAYLNSQIHFYFAGGNWGGFSSASSVELYAYSVAWILFACAFPILSGFIKIPKATLAFKIFMGLACVKIFLFDSANLDGFLRVLSFAVLGAILVGFSLSGRFFKDEN